MRHTVCACTGMPRQDAEFLFEYGGATPESRVESMRGMKPTTGFGETFQYSNTLVATGGYVAAHAAEPKKSSDPAFDEPCARRCSCLRHDVDHDGSRRRPPRRSCEPARPRSRHASARRRRLSTTTARRGAAPGRAACGRTSTTSRRVLLVELGRGTIDGKRVVSEKNLLARREPQVKIDDKAAYGLGLFSSSATRSRWSATAETSSATPPTTSSCPITAWGSSCSPTRGARMRSATPLKRRFLEVLFDGRPEAKENLAFGLDRRKQAYDVELARVAQKPSTAFVERVVGTWTSPGLGKMVIKKDKDRAIADVGEW